jgi:cytochrome P450
MQIPTWSCMWPCCNVTMYSSDPYPVHRDPRYFSPDPTVFWPERWLPDEGPKTADARGQAFRLDTNAFNTFSYGASFSSCT